MPTVVSYTSVALMQMTLAEIGSISTMNSSTMLHHASMAETLINAKLAKKYTLPFTTHIPILETLATDLAIYNVLTSRITIKAEHPWFQRYKGALKVIDEIVKGDMNLLTSTGVVITERNDVGEIWSNKESYLPTFHEGSQEDQIQDANKIQDGLDERDL